MPREQPPVTVVVPEYQQQPSVVNVTVHVHRKGKGGWLLILIAAALAWDGYFNSFGYTTAAFNWGKSFTPEEVSEAPPAIMKGVDQRLVSVIQRAQKLAPFTFEVRECLRSQQRQELLFVKGVSWTRNSYHKTGHACDIGKPGVHPTDNKNSWKWARKINRYMQQAGRELRIKVTWGGDWKGTPDGFHWQVPRDKFVTQKKKPAPCTLDGNQTSQIIKYVECEGVKAGLPKGYMATVAYIESKYDINAVSSAGAQGLYQFMPMTAAEVKLRDPFDIKQSTKAAIAYNKKNAGTLRQDYKPVELYMTHNQGVCGYNVLTDVVAVGSSKNKCGTRKPDGSLIRDTEAASIAAMRQTIYRNILGNTSGRYQRIIKKQGSLNRKAAKAYITFMTKVYYPKGARAWKKLTR